MYFFFQRESRGLIIDVIKSSTSLIIRELKDKLNQLEFPYYINKNKPQILLVEYLDSYFYY